MKIKSKKRMMLSLLLIFICILSVSAVSAEDFQEVIGNQDVNYLTDDVDNSTESGGDVTPTDSNGTSGDTGDSLGTQTTVNNDDTTGDNTNSDTNVTGNDTTGNNTNNDTNVTGNDTGENNTNDTPEIDPYANLTPLERFNTEINNAADGQTIYLTGDIKINVEFDLTKNLIIDGNGHIIDAQNKARIFSTYNSLTLKNIILKNGKADQGGAIKISNADLIIQNCQLIANKATSTSAGAIHMSGGHLTIKDSTFDGNYIKHGGEKGYGGAIYLYQSSSTITNSIFKNNYCIGTKMTKHDGATNYNFNGGVIYYHSGDSNTITGCTFTNNSVSNHGGSIFAYKETKNLKIDKCTFTKGQSKWEDGGAISFGGGKLTVTNTKFTNNFAYEDGGAMDTFSMDEKTPVYVTIDKCSFSSNTGYKGGGAIWMGIKTKYTIKNSNFTSNKASVGGSLFITGTSASITNCIFNKNKANKITSWTVQEKNGGAIQHCGGAIYNPDCKSVSLSKCKMTYNSAVYGGAYYDNSGKTTMSNCVIDHNTASKTGGGVAFKKTMIIKSSKITNNKATYGGGIWDKGTLTLSYSTVQSNQATYGGGIFVDTNGKGSITNNIIRLNSAKTGGGIKHQGSSLTVKGNAILSNKASYYSGVYASKKITLNNNWWGALKAKSAPSKKVVNVKVTYWLYMKASASPAKVSKGKTSTVTFDLRYNNKNKKIASSAKLPISLTATSGKLSVKSVTLSSAIAKVKYTKTVAKAGKVTGKIYGISISVTIK